MKNFAYSIADSFPAAAKELQNPNTVAKAGGTDLLDLLKERIIEPDETVNLQQARKDGPDGELSALATLADVAANEKIRKDFPALAEAAGIAATPQVRNFATVGGNLCQHTRCWYFRNASFACVRRGDPVCSAQIEGADNRYHAIFPTPQCASAHPSNLAPPLVALGAKLACVHPDGDRTMDVALLYEEAKPGVLNNLTLRPGELIRGVQLKATPLTRLSTYMEFRERESFDFAVVSVAAALEMEGGKVKDARIVLGAVAGGPYRATRAENVLRGNALDPQKAADAALAGARPLEHNRFKVTIAKTLVRRALEELGRRSER